jgi:hypothetical protein
MIKAIDIAFAVFRVGCLESPFTLMARHLIRTFTSCSLGQSNKINYRAALAHMNSS